MHTNRSMLQVRKHLKLTLRDVAELSVHIAADRRNRRFQISPTKLSAMEHHYRQPSIHQACTLALLYGVPICEVLSWYLGAVVEQANAPEPRDGLSEKRCATSGPRRSDLDTGMTHPPRREVNA